MEQQTDKKQYIVIAFTLKGQNFAEIKPALEAIAEENPDAILIHGFMSREDLALAGITDTSVVDNLNNLFPEQRSFFKDGEVRRRDMFSFAYDNLAKVYVIGKIKDGVKEEVFQYISGGMDVYFIRLGDTSARVYPMGEDDAFKPEELTRRVMEDRHEREEMLDKALVLFGNYLLSPERHNNIKEAHPEWDEVEVERHAGEVMDADLANWKSLIFSNHKTSNDMKTTRFQRNTDHENAGGGAGTGTNEGGQNDQNLKEGEGNAGGEKTTSGEGANEGGEGTKTEGEGTTAGTGTQEGGEGAKQTEGENQQEGGAGNQQQEGGEQQQQQS